MTHLATLRNPRPLVVLLAALLALPALAVAQLPAGPPSAPGPGFGPHAGGPDSHGFRGEPGGRGPFGNLGFVADFLDLTDEQREQARSLRENLIESHRALWEQTRTLRQELRMALDEETPDTTHIGELTLALHEQRQKARALREHALSDFEALLTADQLETFQQLRQTVQERRRERREFRRQRWEERRGGRPDGA